MWTWRACGGIAAHPLLHSMDTVHCCSQAVSSDPVLLPPSDDQKQQKDRAGPALSVSGGVWRTAGQCRDGSHAEVIPACGCYPALFKFTAVGGNTLPLTRCIGETEKLCSQKQRG